MVKNEELRYPSSINLVPCIIIIVITANYTLKGNVNAFLTLKHVKTNDVKNHIFTLVTNK